MAQRYDYEFLPEALKRLLKREESKTCGSCHQPGSLRCTRCRCQYYCSSECQRAHFERHKRNCKSIGKARHNIDTLCNDVVVMGSAQLTLKLQMTVLKINLADLLVKVAYEECDTIPQGNIFYREALQIYASPLKDPYLDAHSCRLLFTFLEERVMLTIMLCGGDTEELEPVYMNCGGHDVDAEAFRQRFVTSGRTSGAIDLVKCETHMAYIVTRGCLTQSNQDCFQWHMFWLLAYMMKLSKYRENLARLDAFQSALNETVRKNNIQGLLGEDIVDHVSKYLIGEDDNYFSNVLPDNIRVAINAIRRKNHGDDLLQLKHAEPFTREHSPGLFPGLGNALEWFGDDNPLPLTPPDMNMMLSEISFGGGAPPECWMAYQKCILGSFGGNEIVREFIEG